MQLARFSFGTGDRFGMQGEAQLAAVRAAAEQGVQLDIVWNKSHREHGIVGTIPDDVRQEADAAVQSSGWRGGYFVDADHINLTNVAGFLDCSDFFTIDVADFIGEKASAADLAAWQARAVASSPIAIAGLAAPLVLAAEQRRHIAEKYLFAAQQAGRIYRHIAAHKGAGSFITEVSMDETNAPQTPAEVYCILAMLAGEGVPVQTLAPKFTGRFNKGVNYQGDVNVFTQEFHDDVCVLRQAVADFGLPAELKLSVHSGSDKFSIYPAIRAAVQNLGAGVHVKTAGTSWLEELIGLAEAGGEASQLVRDIYRQAWGRFDELCQPYATVIDIERAALPSPEQLEAWEGARLAATIRHEQSNPHYDSNVRQLLHVGYKVAAEYGQRYRQAVQANRELVGRQVTENLYRRHIQPLFLEEEMRRTPSQVSAS